MFGLLFSEIIDGDGDAEFTVGSFRTPGKLKGEEYFDFLRLFGIEPEEEKIVGGNYFEGKALTKEKIFQIFMDNDFLVKRGFLAKIRAQWQLRKFLRRNYPVPGYDKWRYVFRRLPKDKGKGRPEYQLTKEFCC